MNDKEIIKVLERYKTVKDTDITTSCIKTILLKETYLLINRQQSAIDAYMQENDRVKTAYIQVSMDRDEANAEIERLKVRLRKEQHQFADIGKMYSEIRAEAIKEFADRLKEHLKGNGGLFCVTTMNARIDNLVKEMVGEQR